MWLKELNESQDAWNLARDGECEPMRRPMEGQKPNLQDLVLKSIIFIENKQTNHGLVLNSIVAIDRVGIQAILMATGGEGKTTGW